VGGVRGGAGQAGPTLAPPFIHLERPMGKYLIAWLLGVPAFVLVLFYLFFR
jgi:hypothetical protein